jgi:hypothetical protein
MNDDTTEFQNAGNKLWLQAQPSLKVPACDRCGGEIAHQPLLVTCCHCRGEELKKQREITIGDLTRVLLVFSRLVWLTVLVLACTLIWVIYVKGEGPTWSETQDRTPKTIPKSDGE